MTPVLRGRAWLFGDNISGDDGIIDFSQIRDYTKGYDEDALAKMCFERIRPKFAESISQGDIVVGGRNFAKDNHPQVPVAIKATGVAAVVCESTDAGFVRKALNVGLPVLVCRGVTAVVAEGADMSVDLATGRVVNEDTGTVALTQPFSGLMLEILGAGGLVPHLKEYVRLQGASGATT